MSRSSPKFGKKGSPGSETASTGQGLGFAWAKRRKSCESATGRITRFAWTLPGARPAVGPEKSPARIRRRSRLPASTPRSSHASITHLVGWPQFYNRYAGSVSLSEIGAAPVVLPVAVTRRLGSFRTADLARLWRFGRRFGRSGRARFAGIARFFCHLSNMGGNLAVSTFWVPAVSAVYLALAIMLEICGTTSLKLSDGFTRIGPSGAVVLCYAASFALLSLALRGLELSIAYAVWSGVGTGIVATIGIFWFGESAGGWKLLCLALIVLGVAGLHLSERAP